MTDAPSPRCSSGTKGDPYAMTVANLRRRSQAVYLACEEAVAKDISDSLTWAADEIERLSGVAQGSIDRDKLWHLIAKHIACEEDCQKWPNGCGCAMAAADAILASPPAALRDAVIAAREDERRECAAIAEKHDDCGGQFIAQKIRDRYAVSSTDRVVPPADRNTAAE